MGSSSSNSSWADGRLKKRKGWEKYIFSRNSEGPVRPSVPCCFGARGALATLLLAAAAGGLMGWEKGIFPRNSEGMEATTGTLGTFSTRFYSIIVLPCLAVLVPGDAFGQQQQ